MSPNLSQTFRSLRIRNYRPFAAGQVVSNSRTCAQRAAPAGLGLPIRPTPAIALPLVPALLSPPLLLCPLCRAPLAAGATRGYDRARWRWPS